VASLDLWSSGYAILAFGLAYVTFLLGILLVSFPAPVRWMRQAGFELIADSYAAVFLFTILVALFASGQAILEAVYPPFCYVTECACYGPNAYKEVCFCTSCTPGWSGSLAWLSKEKTDVILVITELSAPKSLLQAIGTLVPNVPGLSFAAQAIISETQTLYELATAPINNMLMAYGLTLVGLDYTFSFLQAYWWQLIFLGAVFWAVPARMGRIVGSWMIAFPLTFYFGLPGLRLFIGWFTGYESLLLAFNATALGNIAKAIVTANILDVPGVVTNLLQAGNDFAGYMVLRTLALGLYMLLLGLVSSGIASVLSHASVPTVEGLE